MGFLIRGLFAVLIGLAVGLGSAYWAISQLSLNAGIQNGPWRTNALIGSEALDIYTRAGIAVGGLFALKRSEAVYFATFEDSAGNPLDGACVYRIDGMNMPARWWSITAYGADHFLIPNPEKRYSVTRADLVGSSLDGDTETGLQSFTFRVAQDRQTGAWLPMGEAENFSLTLRLYGLPERLTDNIDLEADLASLSLPVITRESCS